MDKSRNHKVEKKKQVTKKGMQCDSIYSTSIIRQNSATLLKEVSMWVNPQRETYELLSQKSE